MGGSFTAKKIIEQLKKSKRNKGRKKIDKANEKWATTREEKAVDLQDASGRERNKE